MTTDTEALRRAFEAFSLDGGLTPGDLEWNGRFYIVPFTQDEWLTFQAGHAAAKAEPAAPQILKGIGKTNGDGWKDTTRQGQVVFVYASELPAPYSPGQYPRVGSTIWSASTNQFDFTPATVDEVRECFESMLEEAAKAETADASDGRWYVLSNDGMATLCADEDDAKELAADADVSYPRMAPHRAVQLVPAAQLAAAVAANNSEHAHAMAVLRQIADMPRRTREQRLASACVRFLDAIRAGEPNDA